MFYSHSSLLSWTHEFLKTCFQNPHCSQMNLLRSCFHHLIVFPSTKSGSFYAWIASRNLGLNLKAKKQKEEANKWENCYRIKIRQIVLGFNFFFQSVELMKTFSWKCHVWAPNEPHFSCSTLKFFTLFSPSHFGGFQHIAMLQLVQGQQGWNKSIRPTLTAK